MTPSRVVDGLLLPAPYLALLKPGEAVVDELGNTHFLPRFFYEIDSWDAAKKLRLSEHFTLAELMAVDCREAPLLLESFPHYVPCAVSILACYLELFRQRVEAPVFVSVNGGYRSPAHQINQCASPHNWAAAADIYRIGDTYLGNQKEIDRYGGMARMLASELFAKPFGGGKGETDDHLHLDIGYVSHAPRGQSEAR